MANQYHDFELQPTPALKLERLNLHITELLEEAGGARISAGGSKSRDPEAITNHLDRVLYPRQKALEAQVAGSAMSSGMIYSDFR